MSGETRRIYLYIWIAGEDGKGEKEMTRGVLDDYLTLMSIGYYGWVYSGEFLQDGMSSRFPQTWRFMVLLINYIVQQPI